MAIKDAVNGRSRVFQIGNNIETIFHMWSPPLDCEYAHIIASEFLGRPLLVFKHSIDCPFSAKFTPVRYCIVLPT